MAQPEYSPPRTPFGDIYSWNTPETDKATEDLFHQQMFRQQYLGRQEMQLDSILNRELSKSKSADMPDLINSYQNYKALKQRTLFDRGLQNHPLQYDQVNRQANSALGDLMSKINQSNQQNQWGQNMISEWKQHPERFATDFGDRSQAFFQTPTSTVGNHPKFGDLGNINTYLTTEPTTNFQPILQKAQGTKTNQDITEQSPDGLQTIVKSYPKFANPYQYYTNLVGGIAGSKAPHDFVAKYGFTPEDEQKTIEQFNALKQNPLFNKINGLTGQEDFPAGADLSQAGHTAKLMAMQHAINTFTDQPSNIQHYTNQQAKMQAQNQLILGRFYREQPIRQADADERIDRAAGYVNARTSSATSQGMKVANDAIDAALANEKNNHPIIHTDGTKEDSYSIPISQDIKNALSYKDKVTGKLISPDDVRVSKDRQTITPLFYSGEASPTGSRGIIKDLSQPMTVDNFQTLVANHYKAKTATTSSSTTVKAPTDINKLRQKYQY